MENPKSISELIAEPKEKLINQIKAISALNDRSEKEIELNEKLDLVISKINNAVNEANDLLREYLD
ncbi:hypothetical protein [Chryseobacterium aquaticum]|uniref:Uncharacterized protein n=1 Tax=Chryseobacterium aquaticum subsp. greenlandense TaxID=345663 RepID=A0A124F303_9FLAO|nr:hypothetical protein [Chryseobacterium aquaticum]KUJ56429.1 hypothetical protein AR686_07660 [Chryseobacterium aquaticum subsp. greenlandense]